MNLVSEGLYDMLMGLCVILSGTCSRANEKALCVRSTGTTSIR